MGSVPVLSSLAVSLVLGSAPDLALLVGDEWGPHGVGFRSIEVRDTSRPWPAADDPSGERGRPVQIGLWYPTRDTASPGLSVRDYVLADALGDDLDTAGEERVLARARRSFEQGLEAGLEDDAWARALAARGRAHPGAAPLPGRRPLLLFETSLGGRSYAFVPLVEMLASHGWVVAALACYGHGESERLGFDLAGLEQQVADMKRALRALAEEPEPDLTRVALLGWSVGGVSQALLRLEDPAAFRAAVSLDSGTGYAYGAELLEAAGGFAPEQLSVPFLHYDVGQADFDVPRDDSFLRAHQSPPGLRILLPDLRHGDLVLPAGLGRAVALESPPPEGLERLGESLRQFLAEHLPPDAAATPAEEE